MTGRESAAEKAREYPTEWTYISDDGPERREMEEAGCRSSRLNESDARVLSRLLSSLSKDQEDEHRRVSQELLDQVGQMLSALRMELGNIEKFRHSDVSFAERLAEARRLAEEAMQSVRDISMGLPLSMRDNPGLEPR